MNQARRKTLTSLDLFTLSSKLEAFADRAESAAQDWRYPSGLAALREVVEAADNEAGVADAAQSEIQVEAEEEQGGYDNLPEGLRGSERGQRMEDAVGHLNEASDLLTDVGFQTSDAAKMLEALDDALAGVSVDSEGRWAFSAEDDADEAESLVEQIKDSLRCAAIAAQEAAEAVERAIEC